MNKRDPLTARTPALSGDELMFALLRCAGGLEKRLEEALGEVGLSLPKYGALTHLVKGGEPLSLGECAARMTCVRSNITQLMDRLESDGLVQRVEDPNDRRAVRAAITPMGVKRQAAGALQVERVREQFAKTLSGVDQSALKRVLAALQ